MLSMSLSAQSMSGRVIDKTNSEPIPYVNVGILNGHRGTVSNDQGLFNLDLSHLPADAKLRFSYIGFKSVDLNVAELETLELSAFMVELEPVVLEMSEVLVFPREYAEQVKGNPHTLKFIQAGFSNDSLGYELGVLIKIKKRPTLVKMLTLHNLMMTYDSVFYRLNVYEMDGETPGKNVLKQPIYITLSKSDVKEDVQIDLNPYHIVVQDDFVISLEYVREQGEGSLVFGAGFLNGRTFHRKTSQDRWFSDPVGIGMSTLIRYQK